MNASLAAFLTQFERQVRAARGTSAVREVGALPCPTGELGLGGLLDRDVPSLVQRIPPGRYDVIEALTAVASWDLGRAKLVAAPKAKLGACLGLLVQADVAPTRWRHAVNAAQRAIDLADQPSAAHHAVAWCEWPALGDATSWTSYLAWGRAQTAALRVGNLRERVLGPALRRKRAAPEIYAPDGEAAFALAVSKSGSLGAYPAFWGVDAADAPVCLFWFFELVQDLLTGLTLQPDGQLT